MTKYSRSLTALGTAVIACSDLRTTGCSTGAGRDITRQGRQRRGTGTPN